MLIVILKIDVKGIDVKNKCLLFRLQAFTAYMENYCLMVINGNA